MSHRASRGWVYRGVMVCAILAGLGTTALGDVVSFSQLYCDALYGTAEESSNSLAFLHPTFLVTASGAGDYDWVDGDFSVLITATSGNLIGSITVREWGVYTLKGSGGAVTQAEVSTPVLATIVSVNGQELGTPIWVPGPTPAQMTFTPKASGKFNLVDDAGLGVGWAGSITLDIAGALPSGLQGGATQVALRLDNVLWVQSEAGSQAAMAKKGFEVDVIVPEPSFLVLLVGGSLALVAWRRDRV